MLRVAPLLFALLLTACASHQPTDAEVAAADAANAANDAATCKASGLQPDTPAYMKCVDGLADQRAAETDNGRKYTVRALLGQPLM